jgi:DNA-binding response OmpR family regulator
LPPGLYEERNKAIQAMQEGASDYITKPFRLEDIMLRVERALQAKKREESIRRLTGLFIISIPVWIILGIFFGILWKR